MIFKVNNYGVVVNENEVALSHSELIKLGNAVTYSLEILRIEGSPKYGTYDTGYPTFDDFWQAYDKKVGLRIAEKLWFKMSKKDREAVMNYLPAYKEAQPNKKFRKDPQTFLRNRAWEDEIIHGETHTNLNGPGKNQVLRDLGNAAESFLQGSAGKNDRGSS